MANGRVARVLASLYLMVWHRVPLLIFADRKFPYFQALEAADRQDYSALVGYLEGRVRDTYAWLSELEQEYSNPPLVSDVTELAQLVASLSGTSLENRDVAAMRVRERLVEIVNRMTSEDLSAFPGQITVQNLEGIPFHQPREFRDISRLEVGSGLGQDPDSVHGPVPSDKYSAAIGAWVVALVITEPSNTRVIAEFMVAVSSSTAHPTPICVLCTLTPEPLSSTPPDEPPTKPPLAPMYLRLEDTSPTLSDATVFRLETFARRAFALAVQVQQREIELLLRAFGRETHSGDGT